MRVPRQALLAKPTKTHAKRRVAVGAGTVELLRARRVAQAKDALACGTTLAADAYVFSHVPDGSAPIDPDGITHRFQRLARRLGVRCRLHDLRHFMVTQLVAGGVDWRTVSGRAGHADGHMTLATYAHFQQAQDRQAAEFMDELLVPLIDRPARSLREEYAMAAASINCLAVVLKELGWSLHPTDRRAAPPCQRDRDLSLNPPRHRPRGGGHAATDRVAAVDGVW